MRFNLNTAVVLRERRSTLLRLASMDTEVILCKVNRMNQDDDKRRHNLSSAPLRPGRERPVR